MHIKNHIVRCVTGYGMAEKIGCRIIICNLRSFPPRPLLPLFCSAQSKNERNRDYERNRKAATAHKIWLESNPVKLIRFFKAKGSFATKVEKRRRECLPFHEEEEKNTEIETLYPFNLLLSVPSLCQFFSSLPSYQHSRKYMLPSALLTHEGHKFPFLSFPCIYIM